MKIKRRSIERSSGGSSHEVVNVWFGSKPVAVGGTPSNVERGVLRISGFHIAWEMDGERKRFKMEAMKWKCVGHAWESGGAESVQSPTICQIEEAEMSI